MSRGNGSLDNIVVTGVSGFLGRAVVTQFRQAGLPVIGVCRKAVAGMHLVADYRDTPKSAILIHLAEESERAKVMDLDESADLVRHMCGRVEKMIYTSSGMVYGDQGRAPFTTDAPVQGTDFYSRAKVANERAVLDAGGAVLRLSNLFGAGMSSNNVLSDIVKQIPGTGALHVRDDKPVRDFLSVNDAAKACVLAAKTSCSGIINIGSGIGTSIHALARLALEAAGQGQREIVAASPSGRRSYNVLDISETRLRLEWSPSVSLQDYFSHLFGSGAKIVES